MNKPVSDMKAIAQLASSVKISARAYCVTDLKGIVQVAKGRVIITDASFLCTSDLKGIANQGDVAFEFP